MLALACYIALLLLDSTDLKQILGELLQNACKYITLGGTITLEIYRTPQLASDHSPQFYNNLCGQQSSRDSSRGTA